MALGYFWPARAVISCASIVHSFSLIHSFCSFVFRFFSFCVCCGFCGGFLYFTYWSKVSRQKETITSFLSFFLFFPSFSFSFLPSVHPSVLPSFLPSFLPSSMFAPTTSLHSSLSSVGPLWPTTSTTLRWLINAQKQHRNRLFPVLVARNKGHVCITTAALSYQPGPHAQRSKT